MKKNEKNDDITAIYFPSFNVKKEPKKEHLNLYELLLDSKIKMPKIKEFQGKNRFLSNFWIEILNKRREKDHEMQYFVLYEIDGEWFDCTERYYQRAKFDDDSIQEKIMNAKRVGRAKSIAHENESLMKKDFMNIGTMRQALDVKFDVLPLKINLLLTLDAYLQEGNRWGDIFYGVNLHPNKIKNGRKLKIGEGINYLGKLLMDKRKKLLQDPLNEVITCPRCNLVLLNLKQLLLKSLNHKALRIEREKIMINARKHLFQCYTDENLFGFKIKERFP